MVVLALRCTLNRFRPINLPSGLMFNPCSDLSSRLMLRNFFFRLGCVHPLASFLLSFSTWKHCNWSFFSHCSCWLTGAPPEREPRSWLGIRPGEAPASSGDLILWVVVFSPDGHYPRHPDSGCGLKSFIKRKLRVRFCFGGLCQFFLSSPSLHRCKPITIFATTYAVSCFVVVIVVYINELFADPEDLAGILFTNVM